MIYHIVTVLPDFYSSFLDSSLIKKAISSNKISVQIHNLRDFANDKRKTIDGTPAGGGAGMVFLVEPLYKAVRSIRKESNIPIFIFSPKGKLLDQKIARESSLLKEVILICPRYEGFDQRIVQLTGAKELSIGNYIVMGGDLAAMVFIESTARLIPQVVGKEESIINESFSKNKLEHPQYSKPQIYRKIKTPDILLSGNHEKIKLWKEENSTDFPLRI